MHDKCRIVLLILACILGKTNVRLKISLHICTVRRTVRALGQKIPQIPKICFRAPFCLAHF